MEVKLIFTNVMYGYIDNQPEYEETIVEIDSDTTIGQLFTVGDLSEYYPLSGDYSFNSTFLPFVVNSQDKVDWDVSYDEAKVVDFIKTHNIKNNIINVKSGYVQAGGPGFKDLFEVWQLLYPIIDSFVTVADLGIIVGGAGSWVYSLFKNRKSKHIPHSQFDFLFSRDRWSSAELAEKLDISNDDAKRLLMLFKYKYDRDCIQYIQQKESFELREKLSKIEVRNTGKDYK